MKPFIVHEGLVAPLDRTNVDTDQIIPKQFLKRVERSGFGQFLFYDWRFTEDGEAKPDFILNDPVYRDATVLLSRANFGSGSSREHAPWALEDYGFRAVIAPSFADIFYNNCFKNGMLPIPLQENEVDALFTLSQAGALRVHIDLEKQEITANGTHTYTFSINAEHKERLLQGLDEIGITESFEAEIAAFEAR